MVSQGFWARLPSPLPTLAGVFSGVTAFPKIPEKIRRRFLEFFWNFGADFRFIFDISDSATAVSESEVNERILHIEWHLWMFHNAMTWCWRWRGWLWAGLRLCVRRGSVGLRGAHPSEIRARLSGKFQFWDSLDHTFSLPEHKTPMWINVLDVRWLQTAAVRFIKTSCIDLGFWVPMVKIFTFINVNLKMLESRDKQFCMQSGFWQSPCQFFCGSCVIIVMSQKEQMK